MRMYPKTARVTAKRERKRERERMSLAPDIDILIAPNK